MLEELTREELAEWQASEKLDPAGDMWAVGSMIATNIINTIRFAMPGAKLDEFDWWPDDTFVPHRQQKTPMQRRLEAALPQLKNLEGI